jgi:hypothetical protein
MKSSFDFRLGSADKLERYRQDVSRHHVGGGGLRRRSRIIESFVATPVLAAYLLLSGPAASASENPTIELYAAGLDTCDNRLIQSYASDWWDDTPWYTIGVYIGGDDGSYVGCDTPGPTAIENAAGLGYGIEPLWYGPQMPYPSCESQYQYPDYVSLNTSTAFSQGETQAEDANTAAKADGFSGEDVIYYDMEEVLGGSGCLAAAQSFISGWDTGLASAGLGGGLYGDTCGSQLSSFAVISPVPQAIAPSDNLDDPTGVAGLRCLPDYYWSGPQRIHQIAGNTGGGGLQSQTISYNGSPSFTIDEDCTAGQLTGGLNELEPSNCQLYTVSDPG